MAFYPPLPVFEGILSFLDVLKRELTGLDEVCVVWTVV